MELRYNWSSAPSALYQWHQVIAWHDSVANTLNIHVDHGAVSSLSYSGGASDTTYPMTIGAHSDGSAPFSGLIDEVVLYKRLLTPEQRAWFYNNGQGRTIYPELISAMPNTTNTTVNYSFQYNGTWTKYYAGHAAMRTCASGGRSPRT